jgi:predicted ArsR family transcriptional regulator
MFSRADRIASVAVLDDPTRRAVFDFVSRARSAVSRDAVAAALGLSRRVAALNLDRLAAHGLLVVEYRRVHQRTGPGAGRPSKLYLRADEELAVSVPTRQYELIGELFVAAVAESLDTGATIGSVLDRLAYEAGVALGGRCGEVRNALDEAGYETYDAEDGEGLMLANCPFHRLAREHTDLVCGVNLRLLHGVVDSIDGASYRLDLDPAPGRCCVRLVTVESAAGR